MGRGEGVDEISPLPLCSHLHLGPRPWDRGAHAQWGPAPKAHLRAVGGDDADVRRREARRDQTLHVRQRCLGLPLVAPDRPNRGAGSAISEGVKCALSCARSALAKNIAFSSKRTCLAACVGLEEQAGSRAIALVLLLLLKPAARRVNQQQHGDVRRSVPTAAAALAAAAAGASRGQVAHGVASHGGVRLQEALGER